MVGEAEGEGRALLRLPRAAQRGVFAGRKLAVVRLDPVGHRLVQGAEIGEIALAGQLQAVLRQDGGQNRQLPHIVGICIRAVFVVAGAAVIIR